MTGFNLSPGCEVHHIPGNRPEDEAEERFWDDFETKLREKHNLDVEDEFWHADWFVTAVTVARDMAWKDGYQNGIADVDLAAATQEQP